jgi:hypothetical protein
MHDPAPRFYRFDVTDETITALRRLRQPWHGWALQGESLAVSTGSGEVVLVRIDRKEIEPGFPVQRLRADRVTRDLPAVESSFNSGANDLVLFSTEIWSDGASLAFEGPPGSSPDSAVVSCTITDSIMIESSSGEVILIRCRAGELALLRDVEIIHEFARERGYSRLPPSS